MDIEKKLLREIKRKTKPSKKQSKTPNKPQPLEDVGRINIFEDTIDFISCGEIILD